MADTRVPITPLEANRRVLDGYRDVADRFFDYIPTLEPFAQDGESRQVARLLHRSLRAHTGIIREWLLSPLWLSGIASPSDLTAQVRKGIETDRELAEAWATLVLAQGARQMRDARQTVVFAEEALDRAQALTERTADDIREYARATAEASTEALARASAQTEQGLDGLREDVAQAKSDVVADLERTADVLSSTQLPAANGSRAVPARTVLLDRPRSTDLPVKGNTTRDGEKIFHVAGQTSYDHLQSEGVFASQSDAIKAGYRLSLSPGGPTIKGNVGRDGSRIYHLPGQVNYERVDAEALFANAQEAEAEGFRPAQR